MLVPSTILTWSGQLCAIVNVEWSRASNSGALVIQARRQRVTDVSIFITVSFGAFEQVLLEVAGDIADDVHRAGAPDGHVGLDGDVGAPGDGDGPQGDDRAVGNGGSHLKVENAGERGRDVR